MQTIETAVKDFLTDVARAIVEIVPKHGFAFSPAEAWRVTNHIFAASLRPAGADSAAAANNPPVVSHDPEAINGHPALDVIGE